MANMDWVINTQTNGKNNIDTRDDVDSDIPEVKETNDVDQGEDDCQQDHQAYLKVGKKDENDNEDGSHSETNISPQFVSDDLVSLPSSIDLHKTKRLRNAGIFDQFFNSLSCWNMFLWTIKK